jgi:hypothetical protein
MALGRITRRDGAAAQGHRSGASTSADMRLSVIAR